MSATPENGKISILFIDDEPALLEIAKLFLERSGEFSVETCRSAIEALEVLKTRRFDAIVCDYEMPAMNGLVLLKILRAEGDLTPFIVFTGKGREHVVVEALNNRADFFLSKGADPKATFAELDRMIREAMSRRAIEESLESADRQMIELIDNMPDASFAVDSDGCIISWNRAMEDLTGIPATQMIGKGNFEYALPFYGKRRPLLVDLFDKTEGEMQALSYRNIQRNGNTLTAENPTASLKGRPGVLWARATFILDRKGSILGAIETIRDITDIQETTERQEAEREREKERGLFDKLFGRSASSWFKKGVNLYYWQGRFSDAIVCFDRVLELDPDHADAWREKGICLKELGRYEEALRCFDQAIAIDMEVPATYYAKGETLERLGRERGDYSLYEEAIACFDIVLQKEPENTNAWNYRGVCLKELGRLEEARRSFDKAQTLLRMNPRTLAH